MENTMTNKQKIEAYRLILNFMDIRPRLISPDVYGLSNSPWFSTIEDTPEQCIESAAISDGFNYFSSWDAIMPVVETCYHNGSDGNEIGDITHALLDVNLKAVLAAVIEFIKWYNQKD